MRLPVDRCAGWVGAERADSGLRGRVDGGVYALAFVVIPFLPETRGVELTEPD